MTEQDLESSCSLSASISPASAELCRLARAALLPCEDDRLCLPRLLIVVASVLASRASMAARVLGAGCWRVGAVGVCHLRR